MQTPTTRCVSGGSRTSLARLSTQRVAPPSGRCGIRGAALRAREWLPFPRARARGRRGGSSAAKAERSAKLARREPWMASSSGDHARRFVRTSHSQLPIRPGVERESQTVLALAHRIDRFLQRVREARSRRSAPRSGRRDARRARSRASPWRAMRSARRCAYGDEPASPSAIASAPPPRWRSGQRFARRPCSPSPRVLRSRAPSRSAATSRTGYRSPALERAAAEPARAIRQRPAKALRRRRSRGDRRNADDDLRLDR